ncbi:hypothetical protein Sjap_016331 [Stephania japonica]|uniref:Uncharacterized protein n=1 Tax=Stephania japonica TaxID=461633 RepID=A0AAP0NTD6_9MAGN
MREKWRRVDDEEDDDKVHLSIQEGKMTKEGGGVATAQPHVVAAVFMSSPPRIACGAPLGSPTIISRGEEGEEGWFPPPLLPHCRLPDG